MTEDAHAAVGQRLERHRLVGGAHRVGDLGEDLAAHLLDGRGARQRRLLVAALALVGELAVDEQRQEIRLADLGVANGRVRGGRVIVGVDDRAAGMRAQAMQDRREVGVGREDDELVEVGVVREQVAHVHHHADVGRVLELRGERWAIHHLEAGAQEVMAHERERAHVGRVVALVPARDGVAVAAVDDDTTLRLERRCVCRRHQRPRRDLLEPRAGVLGEPLGGLLVLALQRQVDVVVVDEHRRQNWPRRLALHNRHPPAWP